MEPGEKSPPALFLVGFMGSGKSTLGRLLAARLGREFVDLDEEIEKAAGKPIERIFAEDGEEAFRGIEHDQLVVQARRAAEGSARVVALGGGAFACEGNRSVVAGAGASIWLDAPLETLWERVCAETQRPLARDRERFEALYRRRLASYAQADCRLDADQAPRDLLAAALALGLA